MDNAKYDYHTRDSSSRANLRVSAPSGVVPIGTCIHTSFGVSSEAWLLGGSIASGPPASADWLIARDGSRVKLCKEGRRPFHVGQAGYRIRGTYMTGALLNQYLMGIELENAPSEHCTYWQLDSLAELIVSEGIAKRWRWPYYLVGHYELARPTGRRSDPHGFDWGDFMGRLTARAALARIAGV